MLYLGLEWTNICYRKVTNSLQFNDTVIQVASLGQYLYEGANQLSANIRMDYWEVNIGINKQRYYNNSDGNSEWFMSVSVKLCFSGLSLVLKKNRFLTEGLPDLIHTSCRSWYACAPITGIQVVWVEVKPIVFKTRIY